MEIKCGDYTVKGDKYCLWLEKTRAKGKDGKLYETRCTGYHTSYKGLLTDYCNRRFRSADVNSVKEMLKEAAETQETLTKFAAEIGAQLDAKTKEARA